MNFIVSAQYKTADGAGRGVSFELEFTELTLEEAAKQVQATFGGQLDAENLIQYDSLSTSIW